MGVQTAPAKATNDERGSDVDVDVLCESELARRHTRNHTNVSVSPQEDACPHRLLGMNHTASDGQPIAPMLREVVTF